MILCFAYDYTLSEGGAAVKIRPFAVEEWMNAYEENARYNIAETCVDSISVRELLQLCGVDEKAFLENLCHGLGSRLPELETEERRNALRDAYERDLFQKGLQARYRDLATGSEFMGTILGITPEGHLRIEAEGRERTFGFKEVGYIL